MTQKFLLLKSWKKFGKPEKKLKKREAVLHLLIKNILAWFLILLKTKRLLSVQCSVSIKALVFFNPGAELQKKSTK